MRMGSRHWMTAVIMAIALHAGVAAAMFWQRADAGAKAPGIGGIEIALGPAGGAPGGVAAKERSTEADEVTQTKPATEPPPPETAQPIPEPPPEPAEPEIPEVIETPAEIAELAPPPPMRKPEAPVRQKLIEPKPEIDLAEALPSTPGAGGKAGAQDSPDAGNSAADASAGGMAGTEADYASVLLAWLERHKEYPPAAQQRRQQGVVLLYIVIDRDGRVINSRIQKSSGQQLLDQAALAMLERAQPLPPIPDDMNKERLKFVVPVQFFLT